MKKTTKKTYLMTYLMTCLIAGLQYYDALEVWQELEAGQELTLEAELDNKFDRHAIAISWKEYKLGYIPRGENRHMAKLLKAGRNPYQILIESIYEDRPMNERNGGLYKDIGKWVKKNAS